MAATTTGSDANLMNPMIHSTIPLALALAGTLAAAPAATRPSSIREIVTPTAASPLEILSAREIRRYLYLRTGKLIPIHSSPDNRVSDGDIVIERKDEFAASADQLGLDHDVQALGSDSYLVQTVPIPAGRAVLLIGGDDAGVLYGAYHFVERLGVGFSLSGDSIPDAKIAAVLPELSDTGKPLFSIRGIQPFHDFPEGPDWWDLDDYKAILDRLPRLGMNFIGLHTYPEGGVGPEPTVWIGPREDVGPDGTVRSSYPSSWANTLRDMWGYRPKKTGSFAFGADQLFDRDAYGPEVMDGNCPRPTTAEAANDLFNRAGSMFKAAFSYAHSLGVKTCVGTETPLVVPSAVRDRLKAGGTAAESREALYEGIFDRIAHAYPIDYYWLWTPEGWTWSGASDSEVNATSDDLKAAVAAAEAVKAPFQLATCGWVLGPPQDRALFDTMLPRTMPMSCINRQVGRDPVDPSFQRITDRPLWAIPWLEDDPSLTSPQLWAGRMRKDAADALRYGCTGLMGIHWRTRILDPNVTALARAAWNQDGWRESPSAAAAAASRAEGPVGGQFAAFPDHTITGTADPALYQTVRYDVSSYRFALPAGHYSVTLKLCEPFYQAAGKRVFSVALQGKEVIHSLDLFAKVGQNQAVDESFPDVEVGKNGLDIDFIPVVEFPCIAAIDIEGPGGVRKVDCGGPAYKDYAADWPASTEHGEPAGRFAPIGDFYEDWASQRFGPAVGQEAGRIFEKIDGRLPIPVTWTDGPGGVTPDSRAWPDVQKEFAFVEALEGLRPKITGAGERDRFDYWLNQFRYMKSIARLRCAWGQYDALLKDVTALKGQNARPAESPIPLRRSLIQCAAEVYGYLLATVSTPGELGTVANWEEHILPAVVDGPGTALAKLLGKELPADCQPSFIYAGPTRVIVPTLRSAVLPGEPLDLKVLVLSAGPVRGATLLWRPLGIGRFEAIPLTHVARGVYRVTIPPAAPGVEVLEYSISVTDSKGQIVRFPITAPAINDTVVVAG